MCAWGFWCSAFYRTSDDKLFYFTLQAVNDWPVLCETIDRPELATDPRAHAHQPLITSSRLSMSLVRIAAGFETPALRREGANGEALFQEIQAEFKKHTQDVRALCPSPVFFLLVLPCRDSLIQLAVARASR